MRGLLLLAAAIAIAPPAEAQQAPVAYTWRSVTVGAGGFAPGVIFSRARRGLAYLRTDMGGAYRWDSAGGAWIPLQDGETESSYHGIESLAADPVDSRKVYMAVGMYRGEPAAILRSTDQGTHWAATPLPLSMGGNEDGRGLGERLAIAPYDRRVLLFGSRHDGLWQSRDGAVTWQRLEAFPYRGLGTPAAHAPTHGGVAFVVFDTRAGQRRIYAGIADPGHAGLWRSDDGGAHWAPLSGGPAGLLPVKAEIDAAGRLYVTFANGIGPNGITAGAVWSVAADGAWRDITPDRVGTGGFMGMAVDPAHPGTVAVATIDRWHPGDTIWLSHDRGGTWRDLGPQARRDIAATPWLGFGAAQAPMGHWMTGLAFDPFAPGALAYTTGATVYRSEDGVLWQPWVRGIEQTAIITLVSPTGGAPLLSGFGDLGGFVHWRLDQSPAMMFTGPLHTNTNVIDYAGRRPEVIVRAGRGLDAATPVGLAWSGDGGRIWRPLLSPEASRPDAPEHRGAATIAVTADGRRIIVDGLAPWLTRDGGAHWQAIAGLPGGLRIMTDKVDPARSYALDGGTVLRSDDGGGHFAPVFSANCGGPAPTVETPPALQASPLHAGELFLLCSGGLYRSGDGGGHFAPLARIDHVALYGLGLGADGDTAVYAAAGAGRDVTLWRSLDAGGHWRRIDDPAHHWGNRLRVIAGDPRQVGRLYIGTDGRGIVYGDPR